MTNLWASGKQRSEHRRRRHVRPLSLTFDTRSWPWVYGTVWDGKLSKVQRESETVMSEHAMAIASRVFARHRPVCEVCSRSDVSCLVGRYGIRVPRLEHTRALRARAACGERWCVRYAWFGFLLLGTTTRHRRTARRCEVGELPGLVAEIPRSVLGGLNRYVTHLFDRTPSHPSESSVLCPARSHTSSGTGIHPMEKPQRRREKPRPSCSSPQSGGLDETHYQLHQDHQASR